MPIEGHVAKIALNRPDAYNVIDLAMATCLRDLAREVEDLTDVEVAISI